MRQIPKHKDIDPNTKTIEMSGGFGVIAEGEYIGLKFIKTKNKIRVLGYDEHFLEELKKKMYNE